MLQFNSKETIKWLKRYCNTNGYYVTVFHNFCWP